MTASEEVFDVGDFDVEPNEVHCSSDIATVEVANAIDAAQIQICNAWDSMLRWYDVSQLIH
jgi:hypothetical protein